MNVYRENRGKEVREKIRIILNKHGHSYKREDETRHSWNEKSGKEVCFNCEGKRLIIDSGWSSTEGKSGGGGCRHYEMVEFNGEIVFFYNEKVVDFKPGKWLEELDKICEK